MIHNVVRALICAVLMLAWPEAYAGGDFGRHFIDSTLRVDYVMSGPVPGSVPVVACKGMSRYKGWGGRRVNLSVAPLAGNADVTVTDPATGDTLYIQPFSTLFHEWLALGDNHSPVAMEGTVLLPMPRCAVNISISIRDKYRRRLAASEMTVDPSDIMIADRTSDIPNPYTYIYRGENPDTAKIKVAVVAEGFTEAEMPAFREYARQAVDAILEHSPFAERAEAFDFIALETPSSGTGVAVPLAGLWPRTAFGSHFSTFGSDRYLSTPRVHALYDAVTPIGAHHIIIIANTDIYGGGGIFNFYTITAAGHNLMPQVTVHEFGHSFAGLADEYYYPDDMMDATYPDGVEPWEPNITTQTDFASKWPAMVESGEASLIEGGGYRARGVWRGADDCRMRTNTGGEFCPVCRNAIERIIDWQTRP